MARKIKDEKDGVVRLVMQHKIPAQTHYLLTVLANMNGLSVRDQANIILTDYGTELLRNAGMLPFYKSRFEKAVQNRGTYSGAEWDDNLVFDSKNGGDIVEENEEESELVADIEGIK